MAKGVGISISHIYTPYQISAYLEFFPVFCWMTGQLNKKLSRGKIWRKFWKLFSLCNKVYTCIIYYWWYSYINGDIIYCRSLCRWIFMENENTLFKCVFNVSCAVIGNNNIDLEKRILFLLKISSLTVKDSIVVPLFFREIK